MQSVSETLIFLQDSPVVIQNGQQSSVTLFLSESKLVSGTSCVQEILFVKQVIESIGLNVKLSMIFEIDNQGTFDFANNWTVEKKTCSNKYLVSL